MRLRWPRPPRAAGSAPQAEAERSGGSGAGGVGGAMEATGKAGFVLGNLAEVVERVLGFLPTKALLRAAW